MDFAKSNAGPPRALLVCIGDGPNRLEGASRAPNRLEEEGAALLRRWEKAERPVVFVRPAFAMQDAGSALDVADPQRRPRPGDCVFVAESASLLADRRFVALFEDLGGPLLILLGDSLGEIVLQTAMDGFLAGHPIIIVRDAAATWIEDAEAAEAARAAALPLLSCFARLMSAKALIREWTDEDGLSPI